MIFQNKTSSFSSQSLNFWRDEDITKLPFSIPVLLPSAVDPRGRFPGRIPPSMESISRELAVSEFSYLSLTPKESTVFVSILVGRLVISASIKPNDDGQLRIRLNRNGGIKFADNYLRSTVLSTGIRIEHRGILLKTGNELREMERQDSSISSGSYAQALLSLEAKTALKTSAKNVKAATSEEEIELISTIQQYIDVEYELEQAIARETPAFSYLAIRPEPRAQTYRIFFRMTIEESDYGRLLDLKPGMLAIGDPDTTIASAEVVNAEPCPGKPEIIISVEKQIGADTIPETGQLFLDAMPTLKNVRSGVVEQLSEGLSPNSWFVKVAAQTYEYPELVAAHVDIPESEFPPNPSQKTAIYKGAGTDDFVLVLGPPGTGKTTVILQWVQHFIKQGLRVLVTSQNNKAVDNVLERLDKDKETECVRLGNENKISESVSHLMIDRCAVSIQNKLVNRLTEFMSSIENYISYLAALQNALVSLSTPAAQLLLKEKRNLAKQIESTELINQKDKKKYLTEETTAHRIECQVLNLEKRICQLRGMSPFNPIRWIGLPISLFKTRSLQRKSLSRRKRALEAKILLEKTVKELNAFIKQADSVEHQMNKLLSNITKEIPSIPEKPLNELSVLELTNDCIGNPEQLLEETAKLINLARNIQTIVLSWEAIITTERQRSIYNILLSLVDVVGATCIGINTNADFKEIPFDVVIVDESGQIQIQNLLVPLSRAPKAILVGDHKQLPPIVNDEMSEELDARDQRTDLLKQSWFEWLWNNSPEDRKVMLDTQFRCPSVISNFISLAFYENKYFAGSGMEKKQPLFSFTSSPILFIDTSCIERNRRFEKTRFNGERKEVLGNDIETEIVIKILKSAINELPKLARDNEIGVIVPYANHVKQIQQKILKQQRTDSLLAEIVTPLRDLVASVDSYQGQERDLIILALSRSNASGAVGFLADWRRINVAMTRAKRQLIMIGDLSTLTKPPRSDDSPDVEFKKAMSTLSNFVSDHCQLDKASKWVSSIKKQPSSTSQNSTKYRKPLVNTSDRPIVVNDKKPDILNEEQNSV